MLTLFPPVEHEHLATIPGTVGDFSPPDTVPGLWVRHKADSRPLGQIMAEARNNKLPGAHLSPDGVVIVDDAAVVVTAMKIRGGVNVGTKR